MLYKHIVVYIYTYIDCNQKLYSVFTLVYTGLYIYKCIYIYLENLNWRPLFNLSRRCRVSKVFCGCKTVPIFNHSVALAGWWL